jgi:hypothetical protein
MKKEFKIPNQDKFLAEHKKRFEKGGIDKDSLKAKETSMKEIVKDMTGMPEKLHIMGPLSKPSAKTQKEGENQLQGGESKDIVPEDETPQRKIEK